MNANPKFLSATAHVDAAAVKASAELAQDLREGSRPTSACRCAKSASPTRRAIVRRRKQSAGLRLRHAPARTPIRPPTSTSAPACGPARALDRRARRHRIARPASSAIRPRTRRTTRTRRTALQPASQAAPRQAGKQRHADALRAPGHHHARDGIRRDPREPAAREYIES